MILEDDKTIFSDLVVIELASVLAGPAVGMFFAELGAKVIKIENAKTNGDVTRNWKIKGENHQGSAAYYHSVNYAKEVMFLDLTNMTERQKFYDLLIGADVVISNFSDATAEKMGVEYATCVERNPTIIYAQLFGFQSDKNRVAYDVVLQAESGFLSMNGLNEKQLAKMPVALIDILAAHQLKEGILVAMIKRYKGKGGSLVTTSLEECAIASLANQATNYLMVNHIPVPMGTSHPNIAPYGEIFFTKDQDRIVFAIGTDKQFMQLCKILECEEIARNIHYHTNALRVQNRSKLIPILGEAISQFVVDDLMEACLAKKVPVGQVRNLKQVFAQAVAQDMILEQFEENDQVSKRVKTVAFQIK